MNPTYKKYFTKVSLGWAGCFVVFFFVHTLVLSPQGTSKKQVEKQLAEKKQMYESAQKASQEESKLRLKEQVKKLRNDLKDFVIDFEDSANLTFDISQIASEKQIGSFSIKGKDTRVGSATLKSNYLSENQIRVSFTAGFNQFATFLNSLERHRPVVFVDKFAITRSQREGLDPKVDMDLSVFIRKRQDS